MLDARRPALALFALVLGAYAYFYQAGGWNQNSRFDLTRALVEDSAVVIDRFRGNTGDLAQHDGHFYSDKAPGMSLLAVVPYALARAIGVRDPDAAAYIVTVITTGIPAALSVIALFFFSGALGATPRRAALIAAAYGLGTLIFPYGTMLYGHDVIAACLVVAFTVLARARLQGQVPGPWTLFGVGALLGWAVVIEYPAALVVVILMVYAASFLPVRGLIALALGGVAPALILAGYHTVAFGGPLVLPYSFSTQQARHLGFFMGIGVPSPSVLVGITVSQFRGLFYGSPWLVLAAVGMIPLWRVARREVAVCVAAVVLFVWLNASLVDWDGGWACGPRYLVPALPFLAIGAAGWPRGRLAGAALAVFAAVSAALMFAATTVNPEIPVWIDKPFEDYLLPRFARGILAVSTQGIDRIDAPEGGVRFAWNVGQKLGWNGLTSLVPLGAYLAICGAWLLLATRPKIQRGQDSYEGSAIAEPVHDAARLGRSRREDDDLDEGGYAVAGGSRET